MLRLSDRRFMTDREGRSLEIAILNMEDKTGIVWRVWDQQRWEADFVSAQVSREQ